jgi:hypothetical protein
MGKRKKSSQLLNEDENEKALPNNEQTVVIPYWRPENSTGLYLNIRTLLTETLFYP